MYCASIDMSPVSMYVLKRRKLSPIMLWLWWISLCNSWSGHWPFFRERNSSMRYIQFSASASANRLQVRCIEWLRSNIKRGRNVEAIHWWDIGQTLTTYHLTILSQLKYQREGCYVQTSNHESWRDDQQWQQPRQHLIFGRYNSRLSQLSLVTKVRCQDLANLVTLVWLFS